MSTVHNHKEIQSVIFLMILFYKTISCQKRKKQNKVNISVKICIIK